MADSFRKRFFKTGSIILVSSVLGGSFATQRLKRKAEENSLALNIMSLPKTHQTLMASLQEMEQAPQTTDTMIEKSKSILPYIRRLSCNIATHHILRIQSASFLNKYHIAMNQSMSHRNDLDLAEYGLHLRRKFDDCKLAFDLIDFKDTDVSSAIKDVVRFNKIDYARCARDGYRMRKAYNEIYHKKQNKANQDNDDDAKEEGTKDTKDLQEHELMALYTNAPYLGEWKTFAKIGDALLEQYGVLQPFLNDNYLGHFDGVDLNDLYEIVKKYEITDSNLSIPSLSNLKFDERIIESIEIKFDKFEIINECSANNNNLKRKLDKMSRNRNSNVYSLNNGNFNDESILPLSVTRLGAVQKCSSLSKCVRRVQGPIAYDGSVKMRGSVTFMYPQSMKYRKSKNNKINIIPSDIPLIGTGNFIQMKQIEEWDLKPVEIGNNNELIGKICVRTEPVNQDDIDNCDVFEIVYDCKLILSNESEPYC